MFKYTGYAMWLAPAGVCAAIAVTVGGQGSACCWAWGNSS